MRRLLITVIAVLAVVSTVIGLVSVLVLQASLMNRVDTQLANTTKRGYVAADIPQGQTGGGLPDFNRLPDAGTVLSAPSQAAGTVAAVSQDGVVQTAGLLDTDGDITRITVEQGDALAAVPADRQPHTIDLGEPLGEYRVIAVADQDGRKVVIGLPLASVNATVTQLAVTIAIVAVIGILVVGVPRRPHRAPRAAPARPRRRDGPRVAELPLDRGEVALAERVPDADTDPRTEVGQVGAALNRMLDHVGAALDGPPGEREQGAPLRRRRQPRAAHAARLHPRLLGAHPALRPGAAARRRRTPSDASSREAVRMTSLVEDLLLLARLDEGRELEPTTPSTSRACSSTPSATPTSRGPTTTGSSTCPRSPSWSTATPRACTRWSRTCSRTPACTRPPARGCSPDWLTTATRCSITVTDDGPGIDPAITGTLFERFVRGDASRTRATGSTGLGLAIVHAVVEAHGGTVSVASEPGDTTFTVTIPRDASR